ncbi:ATP-binding protein [Streptomyces spongiae]|uniref:ATP-binding protein n=1 Tax=Streptomyces spongiae TaxID=565072 RepID=A0A5N8XRH8_9ACTN|nr:ATP-binding protein [Streptomyces spongiae]MPY61979.1 ATP-binding protein [Streptomyces spongiae]
MANVIPPAPLGTDAAADRFGPGPAAGVRPDAAVERRFRFELAAHPGSVAHARRMTRARLSGWALCEDTCDTAALVVSELVTNAIVHAAGRRVVCELHDRDDLVRIAVRDEGCAPGEPHPSPQRAEEEHGRGLLLVEAMCRAWGAQEAGPGLLVWADLPRRVVPAQRSKSAQRPADSARALRAVPPPADRRRQDTAPRSDLGWSAKKPPAEDRGNGAEAYHETAAVEVPAVEHGRERGSV